MTERSGFYLNARQQLRPAKTSEEVLDTLGSLDSLAAENQISESEEHELRVQAFYALKDLTVNSYPKGSELIRTALLPYCLQSTIGASLDVRVAMVRARECLTAWLDQYSDPERQVLRDRLLDDSIQAMQSDEPDGACWTIAELGFRRLDIVAALWEVAERFPGEIGDAALSTISSLGVEGEDRERVIQVVHKRIIGRPTGSLFSTLRRLADKSSIPVVRGLLQESVKAGTWGMKESQALRVLVDIADEFELDSELQDRVWELIRGLVGEQPASKVPDILFGSDVAPGCNSPEVVRSMLRWLGNESGQTEREVHSRYLLLQRTKECVRPYQLPGWKADAKSDAVSALSADVCNNTGHSGNFKTSAMMEKESAWSALLCMGRGEMLSRFEDCVVSETNPFLRLTICDLLASFRLDPLPAHIVRWVTEPHDMLPDSGGEWAPRMGAISVARSAATRHAWQALCDFGLTHGQEVLQQTVDAIADVAIWLIQAGDESVASDLVDLANRGPEPRHRTAAAAALESLAARHYLKAEDAAGLLAPLDDEARTPYERGALVACLGYLPVNVLDFTTREKLVAWAQERDDWLGVRAIETLARHDLVREYQELMSTRVGLQWSEGSWELVTGTKVIDSAGFIIGLLYPKHKEMFLPAVVSVLRHQPWPMAVQTLRCLVDARAAPDSEPVPKEVSEAILERIKTRQSRSVAELELFRALSSLAASSLADYDWPSLWDNWLPDARKALAEALGEAVFATDQSVASVIPLLVALMKDGEFAVRRSAYRSLGRQSPQHLAITCAGWSADKASVLLRQRAAEMSSWLEFGDDDSLSFEAFYQRLSHDTELAVREAARRARDERRRRRWATEYLKRVLAVEGQTNAEILDQWCYGQALIQVGDDETLRTLKYDRPARPLPPNVKHWRKQLIKGLEENWRKVTEKWPEP
jgi:hypothetical protein